MPLPKMSPGCAMPIRLVGGGVEKKGIEKGEKEDLKEVVEKGEKEDLKEVVEKGEKEELKEMLGGGREGNSWSGFKGLKE